MNCLHNFPRISALPTVHIKPNEVRTSTLAHMMILAISGSKPSTEVGETVEEEKSEEYSSTMTEAMGASLTYRHELGMNYNFIRPDLIVGSCLQSRYFGVDISAIQKYAETCTDIEHIRAEIRDFDGFDLRMRLPVVVGILYKAIKRNGGVAYIHCTAGMGRAPAVALAYMYWVQEYDLNEAHRLILSKRSCCPKVDAIKSATADILTGLKKKAVEFKWKKPNCKVVEIAGLDVGWGQEGRYEYKYVIDGEWVCNEHELITSPNDDGNLNNYVEVLSDGADNDIAQSRKRLTGDDPYLTSTERLVIRQFLENVSTDE
ncbi:hypothetical protein KSS87_009306 [Heliosperma pusillum]|nr:hypothetical protein KSS87_009306 [Heliosperma pusillum]